MKVVIDTNIVVSAVLRDRDPEALIRFITVQDDWQWYASLDILSEYIEVLQRPKFALPPEILNAWRTLVNDLVTVVDVSMAINFPRDQKDAKFLACALAIEADYFITGDRDFREAQKSVKTTICSVSQFKRLNIDKA